MYYIARKIEGSNYQGFSNASIVFYPFSYALVIKKRFNIYFSSHISIYTVMESTFKDKIIIMYTRACTVTAGTGVDRHSLA